MNSSLEMQNKILLLKSLGHVPDSKSVKVFVDELEAELAATASESGTTDQVIVSVVAGDTIAQFDPSTITGRLADSSNTAYYGKVIGIAKTGMAIGFASSIVVAGLVTNAAWSWTPGATIFLNGASLSQTAPSTGFIQEMGIAKSSDTMYVDLSVPVLL